MVRHDDKSTTRYGHGVVAFYSSGHTNQLGEWLTAEQAHLLSVVLMSALKELHDDLAVAPGQRPLRTGKMPADDVID